MKTPFGRHIVQSVIVLMGTLLFGLGIQLQLFSGAGVDPLTMFEEGVGRRLGLPTGTITLSVNCVVLVIALILNRRRIWIGTIINVMVGPSVNFFAWLMETMGMTSPESWPVKIMFSLVGVFACGFGAAIYMLPDYGVGVIDVMMIYFSEKLHLPYAPVRVVMDGTSGVIGLFLGGTLGIGTIFGTFGIGIVLDYCHRWLRKLFGAKIPQGREGILLAG